MTSTDTQSQKSAGARIVVQGLSKSYGTVRALSNIDLEVRPGEFLALLGPSGSGKTTLLMSLAGFERPDSGSINFNDTDVVNIPPHRRGLGMMFQRYALFPHLDVRRNIEYPLRARGIRPSERTDLVAKALTLVSLDGYAERRVSELSGGQQQRVALARAIVFSPTLLLMDEPLGALDQQLREQVQLEVRALHKRIGATIVFVTHDQKEAMTMADRIAVMDDARISQIGTPRELYERPANRFVAGFIGDMNFLEAVVVNVHSDAVSVSIDGHSLSVPRTQVMTGGGMEATVGTPVVLALRPHLVRTDPKSALRIEVKEMVFRGTHSLVIGQLGHTEMVCELAPADAAGVRPGDLLPITWNPNDVLIYPL